MRVEPLTGLDLRLGDEPWSFADDERQRIKAHWQTCVAANSKLWNGDVLMCTRAEVNDRVLSACFAQTDYASFIAWRDWGWPDQTVCNCFGSPAVVTSDGALIFGVMSVHTANAGKLYPPGGSLEPRDIRDDGSIDIERSIRLELEEETGLDPSTARQGELVAIFDGRKLAVVRAFHFPFGFSSILEIFKAHRDRDSHAELAALEAIRSTSQIDSRMPGFAAEIVRRFLPQPSP